MVLIHYDNCHFNLLVPGNSRLLESTTNNDKENDETTKKELIKLKQKYDNLEKEYEKCLDELKILENKASLKENGEKADKIRNEHKDNYEEEFLIDAKRRGFTRDGPQFNSVPKAKTYIKKLYLQSMHE